jgi:hypothetical protein
MKKVAKAERGECREEREEKGGNVEKGLRCSYEKDDCTMQFHVVPSNRKSPYRDHVMAEYWDIELGFRCRIHSPISSSDAFRAIGIS